MKKIASEETFSINTETPSHIINYFRNDVGFELLEFEGGFVLFDILEDLFVIEEMYIAPEKRGHNSYRKIFGEVSKYCKENNLTRVGGIVDLAKPNATQVIAGHIRFGCRIVAAQNNKVEFQIPVGD